MSSITSILMTSNIISKDCLNIIFNLLDFKSQINFRQVCRYFHEFYITDLYHISRKYKIILNDKILQMEQFRYIKLLDAYYNKKITDAGIKGMPLHKLNACRNPNITDTGIKGMPLHTLRASDNPNITIKL